MVYRISAGSYEATIVSEGAGLAALRKDGRDLVLSHDPAVRPLGYSGKVLVPWPNRIAGAKYVFEGVEYAVPMNEPQNSSALHGLKCWEPWDLVEANDSSVEMSTITGPTDGYPFRLETRVKYELSQDFGLRISIQTKNLGTVTAPYGTGTHAYLTCNNALIDECLLGVPAAEVLEVDANLIPTGRARVEEAGLDLRAAPLLGEMEIDHAFTGLPAPAAPAELWKVTLSHPQTAMTVALESNESWLQIFAGDALARRGVAVEPMTCPPDAFNTGEDLVLLAPGETHLHTLRIFEES